ncbi:MAG: type II toxin-antitoxin system Phd/YefM family antitoxin [Cyanobacteria bacterium P01_D01_bin.36]
MQIPIEDFPESLQSLLQQSVQSGVPIVLTQAGEPIAKVVPTLKPIIRPPAGFMKGTGEILGDIVGPVEPK